jgi:hypothetical protein
VPYKTKVRALSGLVGILALAYTLTFIFDPGRPGAGKAVHVWLEAKWRDQADRIEITGGGMEEPVVLRRRNERWFVVFEGGEYPAKQSRIEEFLRILSGRFSYPVRGNSPASYERLGLTEEAASRIVIRGGAGVYPLLDLLIGRVDSTGSEVYLRRNSRNEVRSGEDRFSPYLTGSRRSWYMLRLFPDGGNPGSVQRFTVAPPSREFPPEKAPLPLVFTRNEEAGGWTLGADPLPDKQQVEAYVRAILDAEGEDFIPVKTGAEPPLNEGRLVLEMGDGSVWTIRIGRLPGDPPLFCASVSGSSYVYVLSDRTIDRIFRDAAYFETR